MIENLGFRLPGQQDALPVQDESPLTFERIFESEAARARRLAGSETQAAPDVTPSPSPLLPSADLLTTLAPLVLVSLQGGELPAGQPEVQQQPPQPAQQPPEAQHQAPEAARLPGGALREGTFDGTSNSRIEYARCPDGTVRPRSIRFSNGSSLEYTYNAQGVCTEVRSKDAQNRLLGRWFSEDGGTTYRREVNGQREQQAQQGELTVRADGTFILRGQGPQGRTFETTSDGTLTLRYQGGDGPREVRFPLPGGRLELMTVGGQLRPWRAMLADRTQITIVFADNNQPRDILVVQPNGQRLRYAREENGDWIEHPSNRRGTLTLRDNIVPQFQAGDQAQEVQEPPRPVDATTAPEQERARVRMMQERLGSLLEAMYAPRFEQETQLLVQTVAALPQSGDFRLAERHAPIRTFLQQLVQRHLLPAESEALVTRLLAEGTLNPTEVGRLRTALNEAAPNIHRHLREQMDADRRALREEGESMRTAANPREAWGQCPVTQRLYRQLVNWLEQQAIPLAMQRLAGLQAAEIPPGSPQAVPQQDGLFVVPPLFLTQAAEGQLPRPDFRIAGSRDGDTRPLLPPTEAELSSLGRGLTWLLEAQRQMDARRRDYELNVLMPQIIRDNNLPAGWLTEVGQDPEGRRAALREMIDLATTVRNYSAAIVALRLDQTASVPLPPGSHPRITGSGTSRRLEALNALLPENLDLQNPENLRRTEQLRDWLRANGPRIEQAMAAHADTMSPERQIFFGQIETRARVLCDSQGRPQEILAPNDPRNSNANAREFNLLDCEYSVRHRPDGIYLDYRIQPREASWYNYCNIGARDISQPFTHTRGPLQPTDLVAVRDSSGRTQIIQASQLESNLRSQQLAFYGSRALTITMDAGMLVAGIASGGTAAAAWSAGRIGAGAALRHGGMALLRAGIGGSGFFLNNAAVRTDRDWNTVNEIRGALMVLDVTQGTARQLGGSALRWMNIGQGGARALSTAERIEQFVQSSGWLLRGVHGVERAAHITMEVANVGYAPMIYHDLRHQWQNIQELGQANNPYEQAQHFIAGGFDRAARPTDAGQAVAQQNIEMQRRVLDSYAEQLCRGRNEATQQQIRALFNRAKELLDDETLPQAERDRRREERTRFSRELMAHFYGSEEGLGRQLADLESRDRRTLTDTQIRTHNNSNFTANRDVRAAAAAAMLFLAPRDAQGRIATDQIIGTRAITIPEHSWYVSSGGQGPGANHNVPERTVNQTITTTDLLTMLREDVTLTDSPSRRMVTGDLLVRAGARSPLSYANILRETLTTANATPGDRMAAILSLGSILNAMHVHEAGGALRGQAYGVSPADLELALRQFASNAQQPNDLRALATSVLHVVRNNADPQRVETALAAYGRAMVERRGQEGAFATHFIQELQRDAQSNNRTTRLGAILSLRDLGNLGGMTETRTLNAALIGCLEATNPAVNMLVLNELRVDNPAQDLTVQERRQVIDLLEADTTQANSQLKRLILRGITNFAVTPEERSRVIRILEGTLDHQSTRLHARDPELRAAAITGLATLSANNDQARQLILRHLNIQHEPDARVRLAAIRALEQLIAPGQQASQGLHQLVVEALRTETDVAVRSALLDARGQNNRPIRDQGYMETVQTLQARLNLPGTLRYVPAEIHTWLGTQAEFNLLDPRENTDRRTNFQTRRDQQGAADEVANWWQRNMWEWIGGLSSDEIARRQTNGRDSVYAERMRQCEALARMAAQNSEQGRQARRALLHFVLDPPIEAAMRDDFRLWAARRIRELCRTGSEVRGELLEGIRLGLLNVSVPVAARQELLEGLTHFVENCPAGAQQALDRFTSNPQTTTPQDVITAFEAAGINMPPPVRQALQEFAQNPNRNAAAVTALRDAVWNQAGTRSALYRQIASAIVASSFTQLESSRWQMGDSARAATETHHRRMIELLGQWRYREFYPALEAIIGSEPGVQPARPGHPYPAVREMARQTLADMRDRVQPVWDRTGRDTDTPAAQRAQNIERLLTNGDPDDLVQALFSGLRGRAVDNAADPRIAVYLRALRDGGNFTPRPGESHAIDGAEKVRLAAALAILERNEAGQYVHTGFSPEDRRRAIELVVRTAFEGSQFGYRQDAAALLHRELSAADNALARTVLSDLLLAQPNDSRTMQINGQTRTVRQLLEQHFRAQPGDLPGGTGTRELSTGRGTMVQQFHNGQLVCTTETLPGGIVLRTRRVGPDLIVERFRDGRIERTALPTGRTYAGVLNRDIQNDSHFTMTDRIAAARRLLTEPAVAPTAEERRRCLTLMHEMATASSSPQPERLQWAHYLAYGEGINNTSDREWRNRGFIAINVLAMHGEAPSRDQARDYVARFTPEQTCVCMEDLSISMLDAVNAAARQNRELQQMSESYLRDSRHGAISQEYLRRIGNPPVANPTPYQADQPRMRRCVQQLDLLYQQSGRTPAAQSSLINGYYSALRCLPENSPELVRIREQFPQMLQSLITDITDRPITQSDGRVAHAIRLMSLPSPVTDELKMQLAEALLRPANYNASRYIGFAHMATMLGSTNEQLRTRAIAAIDAVQPANAQDNLWLRRSFTDASMRYINPANRDQNAHFWQQFRRFLERTGEDRESALFRSVLNRTVEFPLPGTAVDAVSRAETLAQEAVAAGRHFQARRYFEEALQARRQRDGENNIDLARARIRFARYLEQAGDQNGNWDVTAIVSQMEQAANAFRQQNPRTLEGADVLCQYAQTNRHFNEHRWQQAGPQIEAALTDAAAIYADNPQQRDTGAYARCLRELHRAQRQNNRNNEAAATLERMLNLCGQDLPATVRVQALAPTLQAINRAHDRNALATAARQLLTRLNGVDLSTVPVEHTNALWSAIWYIGRTLSEGERVQDSYEFFDRALDVFQATRPRTDPELSGLLHFYADILRRNNLPQRAQQVLNRANAPTPQPADGPPAAPQAPGGGAPTAVLRTGPAAVAPLVASATSPWTALGTLGGLSSPHSPPET